MACPCHCHVARPPELGMAAVPLAQEGDQNNDSPQGQTEGLSFEQILAVCRPMWLLS